jgi:hypothetical protein
LTRVVAGDAAAPDHLTAAAELAEAQLELLRIRKVRARMIAETDLELHDTLALKQLLALDRYERLAHTKRKRAARRL